MRLATAFVCMMLAFTASAQKNNLKGKYKLSMKGDMYYYNFTNDSMLSVIHGKDTSWAKYSVDTTQNPMHLDLRFLDDDKNELYLTKAIYEWVGTDKIRFRMSANMIDRPNSFLPKGNLETFLLVPDK